MPDLDWRLFAAALFLAGVIWVLQRWPLFTDVWGVCVVWVG